MTEPWINNSLKGCLKQIPEVYRKEKLVLMYVNMKLSEKGKRFTQ